MTDRGWIDELAYLTGAEWWPRRNGKLTAHREMFDQAADAGVHVHLVSPTSAVCANGDDTCPAWRSQRSAVDFTKPGQPRMSFDEAISKVESEYGDALDELGKL